MGKKTGTHRTTEGKVSAIGKTEKQEVNWECQAKMLERKETAIRLMCEKLICIH